MLAAMNDQLVLIEADDRAWVLDPRTREIGRRGVEEARRVLRGAPLARN
jgi:hypothetical protein